MIVELALATRTHPDEWRDTDPRIVATAVDVLADRS
jgi:hypothetical protein